VTTHQCVRRRIAAIEAQLKTEPPGVARTLLCKQYRDLQDCAVEGFTTSRREQFHREQNRRVLAMTKKTWRTISIGGSDSLDVVRELKGSSAAPRVPSAGDSHGPIVPLLARWWGSIPIKVEASGGGG